MAHIFVRHYFLTPTEEEKVASPCPYGGLKKLPPNKGACGELFSNCVTSSYGRPS